MTAATLPPLASAGWPLDRLVSALARAGWDALDKRRAAGYRAVLRALVDLLPHGSATGTVTAHQIADTAGMSERWARDRLGWLEEAGVIVWTRGGIVAGRPTPSIVKVSKRAIADLVNRGRRAMPDRLAKRAAATSKRIRETVRTATIRHRTKAQRRTPAPHAELSAALPPLRGRINAAAKRAGAVDTPQQPPTTMLGRPKPAAGSRWAAVRQRIEQQRC